MTWNYRIVRYHGTNEHGLHEVYYDNNGTEIGMTQYQITFEGSPEEIVEALRHALKDAEGLPVFEEPEEWAKPDFGGEE